MARVDYTTSAGAYRRARTLPADVLAAWTATIADLPVGPASLVADVGAGPGGFLEPLHDWFDAPVVAIEPSAAMRDEAAAADLNRRFAYVAAAAETLPLRMDAVDVAWLSTTIHQFDDRPAAARELRRVVRTGGWVLIRGFFADVTVTGLLASFPGIDRAAATFPATATVVSELEEVGFALDRVVDVVEPWRIGLAAWTERVRRIRHVDSALRPLTDAEIDAGIRAVTETYEGLEGAIASDAILRLLVLRG